MDRLAAHLEIISFPALLSIGGVGFVLFQFIPGKIRLYVSLATMAIVLVLSKLPELGTVASICKTGSAGTFVLAAIAALRHPGKRGRLPIPAWGYLFGGLLAIPYVLHTADKEFALIIRIQWLLLVVAAVLTCRTIIDERSLKRVLLALFVGQAAGCLVTFSSLIFSPLGAGYRFMPYGCNPNKIGVLFALTASMGIYFAVSARAHRLRILFAVISMFASAQVVLTVSRGAMAVLALSILPPLLTVFRRPLVAGAGAAIVILGLVFAARYTENTDFSRVERGLDRIRHWEVVFEEVERRPYTGLLFTRGKYAVDTDENAHNAYIQILYLGGLSLGIPVFGLQCYGCWCALRAWLARHRLRWDPLQTSVLAALAFTLLFHGFINQSIYYPTHTWAFFNVLVSCLFMSASTMLSQNSNVSYPRGTMSQRIALAGSHPEFSRNNVA